MLGWQMKKHLACQIIDNVTVMLFYTDQILIDAVAVYHGKHQQASCPTFGLLIPGLQQISRSDVRQQFHRKIPRFPVG